MNIYSTLPLADNKYEEDLPLWLECVLREDLDSL